MRTWYASNGQTTVNKLIFQRIVIIKVVGLKKKARRDDSTVFEAGTGAFCAKDDDTRKVMD